MTFLDAALVGDGVAIGAAVQMGCTLGPPVVDTDLAASLGVWAGATGDWTLSLDSSVLTGHGGDAAACGSPGAATPNCASAVPRPPFNGQWTGKDGLRLTGMGLTSSNAVINTYQAVCLFTPEACISANVYDDWALALSDGSMPSPADALQFTSVTNSGRIGFQTSGGVRYIYYSVNPVMPAPAPATATLVALALAALAVARRRAWGSGRVRCASGPAEGLSSRCAGRWNQRALFVRIDPGCLTALPVGDHPRGISWLSIRRRRIMLRAPRSAAG